MLCFVLQIEYNPNDFETILRMGILIKIIRKHLR